MKKEYIRRIFTNIEKVKTDGIYLSGIHREGEYKMWHDNGILYLHCFYKDGKLDSEYKLWHDNGQHYIHCFFKNGNEDGEYKAWYYDGQLWEHYFYKDRETVDMPKEIKDGYIYVDGKYYKD